MTRTEEIRKFVLDNSSNTGDLLRDVWDALNVCMERLEWAKKQNEIDTTPDWFNAPDWANWRAQHSNGKYCWYEKKPVKARFLWLSTNGRWDFDNTTALNWEASLQKRPQRPKNQDQ